MDSDLDEKRFAECWCKAGQCVEIIDQQKCETKCSEKGCLFVCPAGLFCESSTGITLNIDGICLECGACRLICDNISFEYPPGGKGIANQFG